MTACNHKCDSDICTPTATNCHCACGAFKVAGTWVETYKYELPKSPLEPMYIDWNDTNFDLSVDQYGDIKILSDVSDTLPYQPYEVDCAFCQKKTNDDVAVRVSYPGDGDKAEVDYVGPCCVKDFLTDISYRKKYPKKTR